MNTPAVGDIDNDGRLEMIAANSHLYGWELANSRNDADWPMWKMNAQRTPTTPMPARLNLPTGELVAFKDMDDPGPVVTHIELINPGDFAMQWSTEVPSAVSMTPSSGTLGPQSIVSVEIKVNRDHLQPGYNVFEGIVINAWAGGEQVPGSPAPLSLRVFFGNVSEIFLPITSE